MTTDKEPEVLKVYSSYTPAQKKAVLKYREQNRDKINEQRKQYYSKRMSDPTFLEYKRAKAREYYERKKLKKLDEVKEEVKEVKEEVPEVKEDVKPVKVKKERKPKLEEVKEEVNEEVKEPVKKSRPKKVHVIKEEVELLPIPFPLPPEHSIAPVEDPPIKTKVKVVESVPPPEIIVLKKTKVKKV